jgi:hypothetical protein
MSETSRQNTREGGCSCGTVRFAMRGEPLIVHCCHCRDCQKQTGGGFVINAFIETDRIELLEGTPRAVSMPTDSGRPHDIYRCDACEVAVWSDYGRRPYMRAIRVSTLDEPHAITPDLHVYARSKLPWVQLSANARTFDEFYDINVVWSEDSKARRKAAADKAKA